MVRRIGTGLLLLGVVVAMANPRLLQLWVAAGTLGVLSYWVTQD